MTFEEDTWDIYIVFLGPININVHQGDLAQDTTDNLSDQ